MNHKQDKRIYTLSQEAPAKAVIKMSVPLIFGMFIMVLYNLVDTYFIGLTGDDYHNVINLKQLLNGKKNVWNA